MAGSRLNSSVQLQPDYNQPSFTRIFTALDKKVNGLAEGLINESHNATTSMPSGYAIGTYAVGDFVKNSNPSKTSATAFLSGTTYVVPGWMCVNASTSVGFIEIRWPAI